MVFPGLVDEGALMEEMVRSAIARLGFLASA
jgi:hypothetical protein